MFGHRIQGAVLAALLLGFLITIWPEVRAAERSRGEVLRIGMIGTLFRDVPEAHVQLMMQPFAALMQSQTGFTGLLVPAGDADDLGQQLAEDKVHLGVFHGVEFAWARQKHPELQPLVIAVNQDRHLRAQLVVRQDSPIHGIADLKGKNFALPKGSREHCHLFLERQCHGHKAGIDPKSFFSKIVASPNTEEALDDVVDGMAQAAVVDGIAFDCYKRRKPGRYAKLKILQESEVFPAAVVAYRTGALDDATLQRFRDGMIGANQTVVGRQLLNLWKLTAFERVPKDYDQMLVEIIKGYPSQDHTSK